MSMRAEMHHILDSDPAHAGDVKTGFDREHASGRNLRHGKARSFVDLQAEAMADSMEKAGPATFADFGGIPLLVEPVPQILLGPLPVQARPEMTQDPFLPLGHGGTEMM